MGLTRVERTKTERGFQILIAALSDVSLLVSVAASNAKNNSKGSLPRSVS